ncbi:sulfite exporter TauE/SafE family protein [Idiomarina xiamenensis]|uniref:Urease accessory protein UreH-like transmembrane domain-containing protein n=1 Tax=Idiomarina xiamenensis 10-D-4 TaxID=740709 RepID=K2KG64_9GAMM|nr:sulfite exporter TauE/SafE family protein [Idiomarina xiamenensis]EKE86998.1 hypothetical protein A10D4_02112 [Idiomarina xiamenensis 10-D-4]
MNAIDAFAALLMGLAGAGHCMAMCGGISAAIGLQQRPALLLCYNLGRITTYTLIGALVGAAVLLAAQGSIAVLQGLRVLAALFLLALGLYFGGWWFGLNRLERLAQPLWRRIQPLAVRLRGQHGYLGSFAAGMVWGWLPCGLVYSALSWAALSGSAAGGALYMALFGLGTLPAMFIFALFSRTLQVIVSSTGFRKAMGVLLIAYGAWQLLQLAKQFIGQL